jgi:hypothetical protein
MRAVSKDWSAEIYSIVLKVIIDTFLGINTGS